MFTNPLLSEVEELKHRIQDLEILVSRMRIEIWEKDRLIVALRQAGSREQPDWPSPTGPGPQAPIGKNNLDIDPNETVQGFYFSTAGDTSEA